MSSILAGPRRRARCSPLRSGTAPIPEDLWKWMAAYEEKTADRVLALAHNGNLANGIMFDEKTLSGKAITKVYCETRQKWEPLYEATQIKGDGEAHPLLSPDDEFAGLRDLGPRQPRHE